MKIAFYAPLKSPNHPVPSGDRLMARLLITAFEKAGHEVDLISELRSYSRLPEAEAYADIEHQARAEITRITDIWTAGPQPDIWFSYHPYYKAPDLLGPVMAERFQIPYVTAETSYSGRRNTGYWAQTQEHVLGGIMFAAVNICFTRRDREGIEAVAPNAQTSMLRPFIDPAPFLQSPSPDEAKSHRLITVAMMRPGDKLESYRLLANALAQLGPQLPWSLSVVGDGAIKAEVESLFTDFGADRVTWHGELATPEVADLMSQSALYVWPGYGEAYGLTYLEAQAAGLPVVAMNVAGVPEAVEHEVTGLLTRKDDAAEFARSIERLLTGRDELMRMGQAARQKILSERTLDQAAKTIDEILAQWTCAK
ncbi:MAG: glycosyltransferase family 4 protein [Boseongicola sp.]